MQSDKKTARIVGVLLLVIFTLGVTIYQVLQGPVLFGDNFLTQASSNSSNLILSTLFGVLSGTLSIVISIILLPIIKRYSETLGYLYIAFCILNFVTITIDSVSVITMLELSREYVKNEIAGMDTLKTLGVVFFQSHRWAHYLSLLVSCFPVAVLFYTMFFTKLVPRAISIFGMFAALLMAVHIVFSFFNLGISMDMLLPIAIIQLVFPIWIIIKGFKSPTLADSNK